MDFGEALQARGHRIAVVLRPATPFEDACREAGFAVYPVSFGPKYNPVAIFRVARALRKEGAAVAIVNISKDLNVGAVAAKLLGIPVVHRVGLVEDYRGSFEERLRHRLLVDRVLVPSEYLRAALLDCLSWIRPEQVTVIPNSKRLDRFTLAPGGTGSTVVFGVSSQLSPSKGHTYVFQALKLVRSRGVDARLRVAGEGPLAQALREEAGRGGLEEVVSFLGFRSDMPAFLAELDAYVLPSLKESFSNAVLEAMCAGLPVAAFAAGGVPEVVGDAGILIPPANVQALADALELLARDRDLRARLGQAARRRAAERYDLAVNAGRLEAFLRDVANR